MHNQLAPLRLGIIGLSEGNGHPYSWSAIFNGYDPEAMAHCPFPVIPQYLAEQAWPDAALPDATVTHIWTQDPALSRAVADAARIPHIVAEMTDMLPEVDAVLLARDDPENHLAMARPFLEAGRPIYIDKPVATEVATLDALYAHEQWPGQLFSCSAVGYAEEFKLSEADRAAIGEVRLIEASIPKSWAKYGVHLIDPVLRLDAALVTEDLARVENTGTGDINLVTVTWESGRQALFKVTGAVASPLKLTVYGTRGFRELTFRDTFKAFKGALRDFVAGVRSKSVRSERAFLTRVVEIIEKGARHG
ncbi:MAG: Gfo/Idh/MocA family oxidoreductase [Bacteroidota bacterium]